MTNPHPIRVALHFRPWQHAFWLALFHDTVEDGWMPRTLCRIWLALSGIRARDAARRLRWPLTSASGFFTQAHLTRAKGRLRGAQEGGTMCCEVHFESESAENTKRLSEIIGAKNVIGYDAEVIGAGNYCLCPVDVEASCALAGIVVTQDFDADEHWAIPGDWVVAFGPAPPPTKGETP